MNAIVARSYAGIFRQLGFSLEQTVALRRAGRMLGESPAAQLHAIAAASLGYTLDERAACALDTSNRELGIRCQDVRCKDES